MINLIIWKRVHILIQKHVQRVLAQRFITKYDKHIQPVTFVNCTNDMNQVIEPTAFLVQVYKNAIKICCKSFLRLKLELRLQATAASCTFNVTVFIIVYR